MHYKTIMLELLEQRPEICEPLRSQRKLLAEVERYSRELKTRHDAWTDELSHSKPGSDPSQIASEAMEMALRDLEVCLSTEYPAVAEKPPLDEAMAFIRARMLSE